MINRKNILLAILASSAIAADSSDPAKAAIHALHTQTITPTSNELFDAESAAPANDAGWLRLEVRAHALADAARALSSIPEAKHDKRWRQLSTSLANHAQSASRAAKTHNLESLVDANGKIVAACEACHDDYRDGGYGMTSDKR